jgi:ABC-type uncharacterized transport system permease subunit
MSILVFASVAAFICYLGAAFNDRYARILLAQGLIANAIALVASIGGLSSPEGFGEGGRYGFGAALSATFWVGALILFVEGSATRVQAILKVVLPLAAVTALLPLAFPGASLAKYSHRSLFLPHLVVGTLSYGVLLLAAMHASLMAAAERSLKGSERASQSFFAKFFDELPPLMTMERVLFRFIAVSFLCLSLTLMSGIGFSEATFGQPMRMDHKTIFTLLAWVVLGVLLLGRWLRGWRGRVALRWTMASFALLVLGYVGSRFVLEVVLNRAV